MRIIDEELKEWVLLNLYNEIGHLNRNKVQETYFVRHGLQRWFEAIKCIKDKYELTSFSEAIYWIKEDIITPPLCTCKKKIKFRRFYNKTCGGRICKKQSQEATSLDKYGVANYSQTIECKTHQKENQLRTNKKRIKTNIEKFGVENPFQNDDVKKQIKLTNIEKYGTDNPMGNNEIVQKVKNSQNTLYGGMAHGSNQTSDKIKKTNIEKFGVENPFQNDDVKKQIKLTNVEKYSGMGFDSEAINDKIKETNIDNFGSEKIQQHHITNLDKWDDKNFIVSTFINSDSVVDRKSFMNFFNCSLFGYYSKMRSLNINYKRIQSYGEKEVFDSIIDDDKVQSDRNILAGKELDIYLPSKKIAIEYNGIYWHSELNGKDKNYHLNKTLQCEQQGIQLLHIFETEWIEKEDIVKSIINAKIGIFNSRIYARKTTVREILPADKSLFLKTNHLQGNDKSSIRIGLFYKEELVSVMTFGKSRYNKSYEYEMHRYCNKLNYQIIGGASKLWKYFMKTYQPSTVITYADRRYSDGTFYEKIGFIKSHTSPPNHFYFKGNSGLMSRINWQKHKLKDKLVTFQPNLTAWKNMQMNGYDRIYDCGNYVFIWKR